MPSTSCVVARDLANHLRDIDHLETEDAMLDLLFEKAVALMGNLNAISEAIREVDESKARSP